MPVILTHSSVGCHCIRFWFMSRQWELRACFPLRVYEGNDLWCVWFKLKNKKRTWCLLLGVVENLWCCGPEDSWKPFRECCIHHTWEEPDSAVISRWLKKKKRTVRWSWNIVREKSVFLSKWKLNFRHHWDQWKDCSVLHTVECWNNFLHYIFPLLDSTDMKWNKENISGLVSCCDSMSQLHM